MIKLCIDNTALLHEFHLYEPYLYGVIKNKDCFLVNDFSMDNSDIEDFDITIRGAENIILDHKGNDYEVTVVSELLKGDVTLVQKLYEIDKYIIRKFTNSSVQKTKNITLLFLDHTGNSYIDFKECLYVSNEKSKIFFTKDELLECEQRLITSKDKRQLIDDLLYIKEQKEKTRENEWYFYIFDKMLPHFCDQNLVEIREGESISIVDIFVKLMSYFIKEELIDNKLILRYDMYSERDLYSADRKNFIDMNKIIALLSFDMGNFFEKSKVVLYKGIYNVNIGLDNQKVGDMIKQYSENLREQLEVVSRNKPEKIEVSKRIMPNVSLRNIYLEPVKIKNERLTFFRSSKNIQYLDRVEKNLENAINKRIKKAKSCNIQNICDLRTLRYVDDNDVEKEKLSLIEIKDKLEEKISEYKRKNSEVFKNRMDYYEILEDYLGKQKNEKDKIVKILNEKVKLKEFILSSIAVYIALEVTALISCPEIEKKIVDRNLLLLTCGYVATAIIFSVLGLLIADNIKINKKIDNYVKFVNGYNSKLQISSNEEIKKLSSTYALIILNSDIEYYRLKYDELLNMTSKYEFHIAQLEKHLNIAQRLCVRAGIRFNEIVVAIDSKMDEKNSRVDVNKDVYENDCYAITHFLFETKDYCMMLNSGEVIEKVGLETYIKSINFTEDEVYRF